MRNPGSVKSPRGRAGGRAPKICVSCGRQIEWRKKWERDWDQVRYCGEQCRRRGVHEVDHQLERAIADLLGQRPAGATVSLEEVAKAVAADWEPLVEPARRAARRVVAAGGAELVQGGHRVDPSTAKGPVQLRRV